MLDVGNQRRDAAGVQVVLLDAIVAAQGEEGGCGTVVGNSDDAFEGGDRLVRHPLGPNVPSARLTRRGGLVMFEV